MQNCTPPVSSTAGDSGYLSHSGGSPTKALMKPISTSVSQKCCWRNCPQSVSSCNLDDSGIPASPTVEIQQTLSLYDDFEDSSLSGISEVHDELSDNLGKSETTNGWDPRSLFDSGTSDLSSTSEISSLIHKPVDGTLHVKRKCNFTFCGNERVTSPKRKSYPKALAKYFLSDSSAVKYINEENSRRVSLAGRAHVDFLYELGEKMDFSLIVSKIFSYLQPEDLCCVSMVSSTWHKVCCMDRIANKARHQYIKCRKNNIENIFQKQSTRRKLYFSHGNGVLSQVQNLSIQPSNSSTPRSPPVSPTKVRFHLFYKEGAKLASGEQLTRCPRCSLPAHMNASLGRGVCSRKGCQFAFCTHCHCEFHGVTPCRATLLPKMKTGIVGSKRSRRNLRKLL